ncbi:MAG: hypothetical protein ACI4QV_06370 [Acutalibacteraceae bacterium]
MFFKKKTWNDGGSELYKKMNRKSLRYISENTGGEEVIIGKGGFISVTSDDIAVYSSEGEVFRCKKATANCGELLSLDGVRINGYDENGNKRSVIAHYTYYRK